jgi:arsenate reductase
MKKMYHLASCSTCQRIIKELGITENNFEMQDIKSVQMTFEQIDEMAAFGYSYEDLFSKRAMKYKALGLKDKNLSEADFRNYIQEEYTFLKRPVVIIDDEIFIGNSKKVVQAIADKLND